MRGRRQKRYYEDSGFYNFGYWHPPMRSQRQASEALVSRLVEKIPNKVGRILDVACGLGASTRLLMDWYPPAMITGINISEAQLVEARKRAPGCAFLSMDATRLEFSDSEFDAVICVEAAFHFDTRDAFLRETFRILKPGGSLVLSDILFRDFVAPLAEHCQVPRANFVRDIATYRKQLENTGFKAVNVQDATDVCLGEFRRNLVRWPAAEYRRGHMSFRTSVAASIACHLISGYFGAACKTYLLASAQKHAG
jgi:MPBQ/MSBQ methyltransferase